MAIDPFFGTVLSAAASLGGSLLGRDDKSSHNLAVQMQQQRQFARRGLTWRAKDAMRAYRETGLHPLAMLGVSGPTYTPMSLAFGDSGGIGEGIAKAGQDISRGLHATADRELREKALQVQEAMLDTNLERGQLENMLLRMQIASAQARLHQVSAPAMPSVSPVPDVTRLIMDSFNTSRTDPTVSKNIPVRQFGDTPAGGQVPVMSKPMQEATEDDWMAKLAFFVSERLLPQLGLNKFPPQAAPKGYRWAYDVIKGYYLVRSGPGGRGYVYPRGWDSVPSQMP